MLAGGRVDLFNRRAYIGIIPKQCPSQDGAISPSSTRVFNLYVGDVVVM